MTATTDSPLRRAVDRLADVVVLALLVVVASLPVFTGFCALTAAAAVLGDRDDERPVARRFLDALRRRPARAVVTQLLVLATLGVAVADLTFAAGASAGPAVRAGAAAIGLLLLLGVLAVPVYAAVLAAGPSVTGSALGLLRDGAALALARPVSSAASLLGVACVAAWCYALPALTPVLAGVALVGSLALAGRAVGRVRSAQLLLVHASEDLR